MTLTGRRGTFYGLLLVVALLLPASACTPDRPRNLLLITLETSRADHFGAYGYSRDTSPNLERLAARGALFEQHLAVSPRTTPSLASLMTSSYPHEHGVRNLTLPLAGEHHTLAEILATAGYRTAAVQSHPRLASGSGLEQGFAEYLLDVRAHADAEPACDVAAAWIREASAAGRPWFLWIHLMDPHWFYDPPPPWRSSFGAADPRPHRVYREIMRGRRTNGAVYFENQMEPSEVQAFIDLYDGEIRYADENIGALLRLLDEVGQRKRTVVAVTADHGESLGEQDYFFEHGDFGTNGEIHIPLILTAPSGVEPGTRVPWTTPNIDVAPTLLELVGLPPADTFRGSSMMPLLSGDAGQHRYCFGEIGKNFSEENVRREVEGVAGKWRWAQHGPFKLMHVPLASGEIRRTLYDLGTDSAETVDVTALHPDVRSDLGGALDRWLAEDAGDEGEDSIDPEVMEQLRSLGYVD